MVRCITLYSGGGVLTQGVEEEHRGWSTHPGGVGGAQVSCSRGPGVSVSCPSSAERDRCGSGCAVETQTLHQPVNKWIFLKCNLFNHDSINNN